jgi:NADH dehydrogenase [ubiquinone] 1 alpha subcomplex assembly factor 7
MKRLVLLSILLLPLLLSSCVSNDLKEQYVGAKVKEIEQKLELERRSWEAAEARRADFEKIKAQVLRIMGYLVAAAVQLVGLCWAASRAYEVWAKYRVKLSKSLTAEAKARAQAMKEERPVLEARVKAEREERLAAEARSQLVKEERLAAEARARAAREERLAAEARAQAKREERLAENAHFAVLREMVKVTQTEAYGLLEKQLSHKKDGDSRDGPKQPADISRQ